MKLKAATPTLVIRIIAGLIVVTGVYLLFINRKFSGAENAVPPNQQVVGASKPSFQYLDANFTTPKSLKKKSS
ncbi:hypothetical protein DSO57_1008564 [Entomophthora muscae]|uniref:Uncharacterized protein n=1 Tax=Entomophthora muscae TaxID=34485 RepID=A0ACC2RLT6_9FUNG|nr:hypothetical protein DSO57_1008564 [Entomophthora muscae]